MSLVRCGASAESGTALAGGRYRLDRRMASGRSSEVWRATDLELSRPVAAKVLHAGQGRDPGVIARFRAAACCAASLVHAGIVRVFDYAEPDSPDTDGPPFLVMEFVDGPSLGELLADGPLGAARAMDVIAQTASALDFAHRAGLAHGDIGPQNILLGSEGAVKLAGFGTACVPAGGPGSAAGDLSALGRVAQACLTGATASAANAGLPSPPGQIRAPAAEFVSQLTRPGRAGRPVSAAEIARRAARLRDELAPDIDDTGSPGPAPHSAAAWAPHSAAAWAPPAFQDHPAAVETAPETRRPGAAGRPRPPAAPRRRGLAAVRAVGVIAVALAAASLFGVLRPRGSPPQAEGTTTITAVSVKAADLIGRPVQVVRMRLERLGLVVRLRWRPGDRVGPDTVLSVRPAGLVPAHSVITLTGSHPAASHNACSMSASHI